jgi:hypothetical protein
MANNVIANITATFISGLASVFVRQPSGGFNGPIEYLQCSFTRRQKHAHLSPNSVRRVKSCRILCGLNIIDQSSHISSCVGSFVEHRTTCVNRTKDPLPSILREQHRHQMTRLLLARKTVMNPEHLGHSEDRGAMRASTITPVPILTSQRSLAF